jgi:hypothetical protein
VLSQIYTKLNRTRQLQRDDILRVQVLGKCLGGGGTTLCNPLQATAQGIKLAFDQYPIHARRLSASIRSM